MTLESKFRAILGHCSNIHVIFILNRPSLKSRLKVQNSKFDQKMAKF